MTNPNNYVSFTGRLTKEPVLKESINGKTATVYISLAIQDNFETRGEKKTQFISLQKIVSTQAQVDYHKKFEKGDTVKAICSVETNITENESFVNIVINSIHLLVKKHNVSAKNIVSSLENGEAPGEIKDETKLSSKENNEILLKENKLLF